MLREELGLAFCDLGEIGFERFGDPRVQLPPGIAQQTVVCRVLNQRVLEAVDRFRWRASLRDQLGRDEMSERALKLVLGKTGDGAQQRIRKLASNRCADLRHRPYRGQAVEPRQ